LLHLASCKGLYHELAKGIVERACEPVLIHTDKSKSKEKEAEEEVRQCNGIISKAIQKECQ